jgi:hypothetical protein
MRRILSFGAAALAGTAACTSNNTGTATQTTAAAVAGLEDTHCASKGAVAVDPTVCHAQPAPEDAGADAGDQGGGNPYGPTNYNADADDDDCKYHVKWTSTTVAENADVTFDVTTTYKKDGSPLTGAPVRAEVFLDTTHPGPNTNQAAKEGPSGTYGVGPIRFDKPGKWTVRFHFHDDCNDSETSPHGHAAFFVQIP